MHDYFIVQSLFALLKPEHEAKTITTFAYK